MLNLNPEEVSNKPDSERLALVIQNLTEYEFGTMPVAALQQSQLVKMQTLAALEVARQVARLTEALGAKGI